MPEWLPQSINLGFLVFFCLFTCWGLVNICQAIWPVIKERATATTHKIDAEAKMADVVAAAQSDTVVTLSGIKTVLERFSDSMGIFNESMKTHARELETVKGLLYEVLGRKHHSTRRETVQVQEHAINAAKEDSARELAHAIQEKEQDARITEQVHLDMLVEQATHSPARSNVNDNPATDYSV